MGLVRTEAPAAFLDLDEVKLHLRVDADNTAEDTLITLYLGAAVDAIEGHLHRAILEQTWKLTLDEFPRGCYSRMAGWYSGYPHTWPASERGPSSSLAPDLRIRLPRPSLIDVVSVKYFDPSGTLVTMDPAAYVVDTTELPGFIRPAYGTSWPGTQPVPNAVAIEFDCGFGALETDVPAAIKAACLLHLADLYKNREPAAVIDSAICNLLAPYAYLEAV